MDSDPLDPGLAGPTENSKDDILPERDDESDSITQSSQKGRYTAYIFYHVKLNIFNLII